MPFCLVPKGRFVALALLLSPAALAGCSAPSSSDLEKLDHALPSSTATPATMPWGITNCTYMMAYLNAPASRVQTHLPQGFTAPGSAMLPTGSVGFEVHQCAAVQGLDGPVANTGYGALWGAVVPPDELRDSSSSGQDFFKWRVLVPDAPRRGVFLAKGIPAVDGSATVGPGIAPGSWSAALELAGIGTFTIDGVVPGPERPVADFPFQEFTNATGGVAVWRATTSGDTQASGVGTWHVPAGSELADMVGATDGAATVAIGHWSYRDASIRFPDAVDSQ